MFAIASALGGVSGLLVGMYYNYIDPTMSFQATLKGVVAQVIGGVGNVPGAIAGSLLLGLTESYGIALFGTQLPQPVRLRAADRSCWCCGPTACSARGRELPPEPMTGTFIAPQPAAARCRAGAVAAAGRGRARCCRWSCIGPTCCRR